MAEHPLTLSASATQSRPCVPAENVAPIASQAACRLRSALAGVHAWAALKAVCGHSRPFFEDGPAALPAEPVAPRCSVLPGKDEVHHG